MLLDVLTARLPETDCEAIGSLFIHHADRSNPLLALNNIWRWYFAIGHYKQPALIAEFGVLRGYSGLAMIHGAIANGIWSDYIGWDSELAIAGSNADAKEVLRLATLGKVEVITANTAEITIGADLEKAADIVHIDADHSEAGIVREFDLALQIVRPNGWLLIDDNVADHIRDETKRRADQLKRPVIWLPSHTQLAIIPLDEEAF